MSRYTKSKLDTMLGQSDYNSLFEKLQNINDVWDNALLKFSKEGFEGQNTNVALRIKNKLQKKLGVYGVKVQPNSRRVRSNQISLSNLMKLAHRIRRLSYSEAYVSALSGLLANLHVNIGAGGAGTINNMAKGTRSFIKNLIEIDTDKAFQEVIKLSWLTEFINPNDPNEIWSFISPRLDNHDVDRITKFALRWMGHAYQNKVMYPEAYKYKIM